MEEFASMLEHGGLTDVQPAEEKGNEAKEKREPAMRRAAPRRGQRHRSPSRVSPCPPWLGFQVCGRWITTAPPSLVMVSSSKRRVNNTPRHRCATSPFRSGMVTWCWSTSTKMSRGPSKAFLRHPLHGRHRDEGSPPSSSLESIKGTPLGSTAWRRLLEAWRKRVPAHCNSK